MGRVVSHQREMWYRSKKGKSEIERLGYEVDGGK